MAQEIPISLDTQAGQTVFQALAELPFKYVFELIGKINQATNETAPRQLNGREVYDYRFSPDELELIFKALGQLPYNRVNLVIRSLERQAGQTAPMARNER